MLRVFAHAVQGGMRNVDVFGRYGGEEFIQILRHTDLAGAVTEADRLRQKISELELPVSRRSARSRFPSASRSTSRGEKIMQTFARADAALHRAKEGGRNRVLS